VVLAERFATIQKKKVLILEKRDHIGGNCYDYKDPETGILMNAYGAHLFHTNSERVWDYVTRFGGWTRWDHTVVGSIRGVLFPIPVNINTVNTLCDTHLQNEQEMNEWLRSRQISYGDGDGEGECIKNSEQMGRSRVGDELYEKIFRDYTYKQWNKYPEELDASVLARIPVRNNFDGRYFSDRYQALPSEGYTCFFEHMLDHPLITVRLGTDFFSFRKENPHLLSHCVVIFTGPIDRYFGGHGLENLEYRSIDFQMQRFFDCAGYYQPNSVVNYPSLEVPYTRVVEYKHFLHQKSPHTLIVREYTNDHGEPYYPVPNKKNTELYEQYKELAEEEKKKGVHFVGRLASYKYFNMDQAILNALEYFDAHFS
jgi:UDP-galactopyranose mutase